MIYQQSLADGTPAVAKRYPEPELRRLVALRSVANGRGG